MPFVIVTLRWCWSATTISWNELWRMRHLEDQKYQCECKEASKQINKQAKERERKRKTSLGKQHTEQQILWLSDSLYSDCCVLHSGVYLFNICTCEWASPHYYYYYLLCAPGSFVRLCQFLWKNCLLFVSYIDTEHNRIQEKKMKIKWAHRSPIGFCWAQVYELRIDHQSSDNTLNLWISVFLRISVRECVHSTKSIFIHLI